MFVPCPHILLGDFIQLESFVCLQVDACSRILQLKDAGWRKNNGQCLANVQLWKKLYAVMSKCKSVTFEHVHRHNLSIRAWRHVLRAKLREYHVNK